MKKFLLVVVLVTLLSGCKRSEPEETKSSDVAPVQTPVPEAISQDDNTVKYDLIINTQNYGVEETYVEKDVPLVISLRNQLQEPINITVDELSVRSDPAEFGQVIEVNIPTDEAGEFEMYSSIGNRKNADFSAMIVVE